MIETTSAARTPSLLSVSVDATHTPTRLGSIVGFVMVDFTIENKSTLEANVPFLAFSMLGLHFVKGEGWVQDHFDIRTGKRMIRFRSSQKSLGAGKSAAPCSLRMPITLEDGGSLRLLPGSNRRVSDISDITLFYVAGAANFAPERSSVVISANMIRSHVYQAFPWVQKERGKTITCRAIPDCTMK